MQEDRQAAATRMKTREKIVAAYETYQRSEAGSADHLMALVREFAFTKLQYLDYEFSSGVESAEDWAQDVTLDVWSALINPGSHLPKDGASFYAWLHRIAFNHAADASSNLLGEKRERVSLQEEVTGDNGETYEEDNPVIYESALGINKAKWSEKDGNGRVLWRYDEETVPGSETSQFEIGSFPVHIPEWVRGTNLVICDLIMKKRSYKQIGQALGLTTKAVQRRIEKIRERVRRERQAASAENEALA